MGRGRSGNPAKRAQEKAPARRRSRRDLIDVDVDKGRSLVLLDVGGQITGMTVETTDALILSLTNARHEVASTADRRPHSRACGMTCQGHGAACAKDCPTCHGNPLEAGVPL